MNSLFYRCWACFYLPWGLGTRTFSCCVYPHENPTVSHFYCNCSFRTRSQRMSSASGALECNGSNNSIWVRLCNSKSCCVYLPRVVLTASTVMREAIIDWILKISVIFVGYLWRQASCRCNRPERLFFFLHFRIFRQFLWKRFARYLFFLQLKVTVTLCYFCSLIGARVWLWGFGWPATNSLYRPGWSQSYRSIWCLSFLKCWDHACLIVVLHLSLVPERNETKCSLF